jgi:hypothetical protein
MDNFLAAVDTRQSVKVIIDGQSIFVPRCRLLAHLQLSEIEIKIKETSLPVLVSALIIDLAVDFTLVGQLRNIPVTARILRLYRAEMGGMGSSVGIALRMVQG